jgi:hypothetical protein
MPFQRDRPSARALQRAVEPPWNDTAVAPALIVSEAPGTAGKSTHRDAMIGIWLTYLRRPSFWISAV